MRIPRRDELRRLPVIFKPEARGIVAWFVIGALRALRWAGSGWASTVLEYHQTISGVIYSPPGERPSLSLQGHEAVHDFQQRYLGVVLYVWRYYHPFTRKHQADFEAMAYGYEVGVCGRSAEERAGVAADPVYLIGWTRAEARAAIEDYAARFRKEWR